MKRTVFAIVFVVCANGAFAQAALSEKTKENLDALFRLTKTEQIMDTVLVNMEKGMDAGLKASLQNTPMNQTQKAQTDAFKIVLMETLRGMLSFEKLKPLLTQAYLDTYSVDEIARLRALYETPDAQMMVSKQAVFMEKSNEQVMRLVSPAIKMMSQQMQLLK